jgi:hypothetical protein
MLRRTDLARTYPRRSNLRLIDFGLDKRRQLIRQYYLTAIEAMN